MESYQKLTLEMIPGETPREKYLRMEKIIALLSVLAYPRRGTDEELITIQEAANTAAEILK
jgi:hypothetical protein